MPNWDAISPMGFSSHSLAICMSVFITSVVLSVVGCKITVLFAHYQEKGAKVLLIPSFLLTFAPQTQLKTL
jgi:hypothetical protein